jgi:purine-cytosine permease-like protein
MAKTRVKLTVLIRVVGELLFLFGFLGWMNGEIVQFAHPEFLSDPLSHLTPWIRVDTFAILSFIVSAVGFFTWRIVKELTSPIQK